MAISEIKFEKKKRCITEDEEFGVLCLRKLVLERMF